jgi:hypothetical protein
MKFIFTILSLLISTVGFTQKFDLRLKLESGKEYKQVTASKAEINQELNGQKVNIIMTIKGTLSYLVKSINGNEYVMETKYESLGMIMEMPQATMEFSSEKTDGQDVLSTVLSQMKNKPFEVVMTQSGKIKAVNHIEKLWESAFSNMQLADAQAAQVKAQLMKAYGAEAFKGNIEMVTAILPEKPVAKGESWTIETKLESGMSALMTSKYTLMDRNKEFVTIQGDAVIKTIDKDAYIETNGMPLRYDMSGTMKSDIKIDSKTGWIVQAIVNQEIKGDAFIKENPQIPNGMKIPMVMKNEMSISDK